MTKVLVAFALKEEFAPWRRRHRFRAVAGLPHPLSMTTFGSTEVYVALAGAGARDAHVLRDLTKQLAPALGIVTGVAAALRPEWRPGDMLVAQSVSGLDGEARIPARSDLVDLATQAWLAYGKGRHPAALNIADCLSYALAKRSALPLLFKGDDFCRTDVRKA